MHTQTRGVPQGSVLAPFPLNILIRSIPTISGVSNYVYAADIALFASAWNVQYLYDMLNECLSGLYSWLEDAHLTLSINKCSVLCFPADRFISVELYLRQNRLRQVTPLKYLGVMDDDNQ